MYSYESFNRVKEIIDTRRDSARRESEARSFEVRVKSPEIAKIDDELRSTGMLIFKTACSGGDITPIKNRNQELVAKRRELIKSLGYAEDYTDVKYTCTECSDTGFLKNTKMCSCFKKLLVTENIKASGMGELIERQSFENFNLDVYSSDKNVYLCMKMNVEKAKAFAEGFGKKENRGKNMLLIGTTGTGKTHISTSVAKVVIERGFNVIYESIHNIITDFENDKFRSGYTQTESSSDKYLECDLLIIDDLGTEFQTPFATSCIYNILNTRQNRGFSTIVSTNYPVAELNKRYDDRIFSRLISSSFSVLMFGGNDYRLSGK